MSVQTFIDRGKLFIDQAKQAEARKQWYQAKQAYEHGITQWTLAHKYEREPTMKQRLQEELDQLRQHIETHPSLQQPSPQQQHQQASSAKNSNADEDDDRQPGRRIESVANAEDAACDGDGGEDEDLKRFPPRTPSITWDDIGGLQGAKELVKQSVEFRTRFPHIAQTNCIPEWKSILLYGPPGTGKTMFAEAAARESNARYFWSLSASDLLDKYVGESEKHIQRLFAMANRLQPCVLFIDEIDSMCIQRSDSDSESKRRMVTEFLVRMNDIQPGVLFIAATNYPWQLDEGMRRRLERRIYIPLPDQVAREQMIRKSLQKQHHSLTPDECTRLSRKLEGFSGADMTNWFTRALRGLVDALFQATHVKRISRDDRDSDTNPDTDATPLYEPCDATDPLAQPRTADVLDAWLRLPTLTFRGLMQAAERERPTVDPHTIRQHMEWTHKFGATGATGATA